MKKRSLFWRSANLRSLLPYVDKLYITKIHHAFEGDTFFPEMDMTNWKEIFVEKGLTDEKIRIRTIIMYMRSNNSKKIDVKIHINLFICIHQYRFKDEIR